MRRLLPAAFLVLALAVLAPAVLAPAAHAQIFEAYATFSPTHAGNVQTGSILSGGVYSNQYTSFFVPAVGGGVTLNFLPLGPIRIGFDLRGSTKPGTNGIDTGLVGLKLAIKPPLLHIKPYLQASGGYVGTRTTNVSTVSNGTTTTTGGTFNNHYAAFEGLAGLDVPLAPFFNFRVVEFGVGKGYNTGPTLASISTSNTLTFYTISTGLVFHF